MNDRNNWKAKCNYNFYYIVFFTCFFLNYSFVFDFFSEHKLEKYNARPNECIVFEDSLHGVMASKAAGIYTINIYDKYSDSDREKINKSANFKINSYYEVIDYLRKEIVNEGNW